MSRFARAHGAIHAPAAWMVLLILLATALVPTGCVLWFMNAAMRNEQLAMRQKLSVIYRDHLSAARQKIDEYWLQKIRLLDAAAELPAAVAVEQLVKSSVVDSAVIWDAQGNMAFPIVAQPPPETEPDLAKAWEQARQMETDGGDYRKAGDAYAWVAGQTKDVHRRAQALLARARCQSKAVSKQAAIDILIGELARYEYRNARDEQGRLIAPDARLFALQLLGPQQSQVGQKVRRELAAALSRLDDPVMPSRQRLFLIRELAAITDQPWPDSAADELALSYVDAEAEDSVDQGLRKSVHEDVWALRSSNRRVLGLLRGATVKSIGQSLPSLIPPLAGTKVVLGQAADAGVLEPFFRIPAGPYMPGWRLSLFLDQSDPFAAAARRQMAVHRWTGFIGIVLIAGMTVVVGGYIGRQMRLTRLKNDLIATVSHELKTPLASMRVLVDTLLEGRCPDQGQAQEYLRLIANENQRLSRLIENFLTFSRMERNKRNFEMAAVEPGQIVQAAVESISERLASLSCRLEVDVRDDLPVVMGDRDALVTVLLNLLDNALKYTGDDKHIRVRAFAENGRVGMEVSDNGVGISRLALRRVFDRFYQVDQTLSRKAGGCGLGLSIVKFIVENHGGTVSAESQPDKGSRFTVMLPAARPAGAGQR